jgi:hypothetical protein
MVSPTPPVSDTSTGLMPTIPRPARLAAGVRRALVRPSTDPGGRRERLDALHRWVGVSPLVTACSLWGLWVSLACTGSGASRERGLTVTELTWAGKYDHNGRKVAPLRVTLPFQTVETVNESAQERQRMLDLFSAGRDAVWLCHRVHRHGG